MSTIAIPTTHSSVATRLVTPEDLLQMADRGLFELVDGKLLERKLSYSANLTAGNITRLLGNYAKSSSAGDVLPEQSFQCFPHEPTLVRRPDIAFVITSRIPSVLPAGHVRFPPDLAVEVVSPGDNVYELDDKLADYREAGIPMTWVVIPDARVVRVYRPGLPIDELRDGEMLHGDPVLPGFAANVADLFPPAAVKTEASPANEQATPSS